MTRPKAGPGARWAETNLGFVSSTYSRWGEGGGILLWLARGVAGQRLNPALWDRRILEKATKTSRASGRTGIRVEVATTAFCLCRALRDDQRDEAKSRARRVRVFYLVGGGLFPGAGCGEIAHEV